MSLVLSKKVYNQPKRSNIFPIVFLVFFFFFAAVSGGFLIFFRAAFPVRFRKAVEKNAEETGVEISLIYAVIRTESSFRENAVSEKGAIGLMQIYLPRQIIYFDITVFRINLICLTGKIISVAAYTICNIF